MSSGLGLIFVPLLLLFYLESMPFVLAKSTPMKTLKYTFFLFLMLVASRQQAQTDTSKSATTLTWYTDVAKANEISKATNKPLFALFTGSDWCVWCKRLQKDVFSKPEFIQWANKNVVLLELDFPRSKQLSPEMMQQNASLQQAFNVQGYPTIWVFYLHPKATNSFDIEALGSLGYPQGAETGKEQLKFLKDAKDVLAKKK